MFRKKQMYAQLFFQLIALFLTSLILDFGEIMRCFIVSMATYWGIVYCLFRSKRLRGGLFLRFGIVPIFLLVLLVKFVFIA